MTFRELGEVLQRRRIEQGIAVEDVIRKTKVGRRNIEAVEEGRIEDLPHPVYVKGFVKIYSHMLGLDLADIRSELEEAYAELERRQHRDKSDKPVRAFNADFGRERRAAKKVREEGDSAKPPLKTILVVGVALVVLASVIWFGIGFFKNRQSGDAAPTETPSLAAPTPPAETIPGRNGPSPAPFPGASGGVSGGSPGGLSPLAVREPAPVPAPAPAPTPDPLVASTTAPDAMSTEMTFESNEGGTRVIEIVAADACWVNMHLDEKFRKEQVMTKNQKFTIRFNRKATIRLCKEANKNITRFTHQGRDMLREITGDKRSFNF